MMRGSSKRRSSIVLMAMIALLCFVGSAAQAATVTLDLQADAGGTFDLYASSSQGDNFGIAYYYIDLVNILTATHQSPVGNDVAMGGMAGFSGGRSDLTGDGALFAYQDTNSGNAPDSLIYSIGQTVGTRALTDATGVPWAAPVLLASGTYDTQGPAPWFGQEVLVTVFAFEWTGGDIPGLIEQADVVLIPEPATLGLMVIGGLAMLRDRRRKM